MLELSCLSRLLSLSMWIRLSRSSNCKLVSDHWPIRVALHYQYSCLTIRFITSGDHTESLQFNVT